MKVLVVSDENGRIISLTRQEDLGPQPSGIVKFGVVPESGHRAHNITLSPELEKEPLLKLHNEFRVEVKGKRPTLVRGEYPPERRKK